MTNLVNRLTNVAVWLENGCEPAMAAKELRSICSGLADEPSLAERETAIRQIPSARGDIAASGPRNGPAIEPTAELPAGFRLYADAAMAADPANYKRAEPTREPVIPFVHWSKDPLVPYPGCACVSCSSLDHQAEPTPERNLLREVLVANDANVDTATHLPEDLTDRIRALVDQGGQRGS